MLLQNCIETEERNLVDEQLFDLNKIWEKQVWNNECGVWSAVGQGKHNVMNR